MYAGVKDGRELLMTALQVWLTSIIVFDLAELHVARRWHLRSGRGDEQDAGVERGRHGGGQFVPGQRAVLVDDARVVEAAGLPQADDGTGRVGEYGHPGPGP
ncbi:hypothetical protein [Streptomyces sp. NPDC018036]|uniref:hypothetical protein n=1 Tax=Streptomyces sp. NPDC018036 TaxID=3365035 RepID=UPI0037AF0718